MVMTKIWRNSGQIIQFIHFLINCFKWEQKIKRESVVIPNTTCSCTESTIVLYFRKNLVLVVLKPKVMWQHFFQLQDHIFIIEPFLQIHNVFLKNRLVKDVVFLKCRIIYIITQKCLIDKEENVINIYNIYIYIYI